VSLATSCGYLIAWYLADSANRLHPICRRGYIRIITKRSLSFCITTSSTSFTFARITSRNLPTSDISLGSQPLPMPEAGEFVELLLLYVCSRESDLLCNVLDTDSTGSVVLRKFRQYFSHGRFSNTTAIYKCVEELRATGSIIDRKRTRRRRVLMKADETDVKSETALRIVARFSQQMDVCIISTKCKKTAPFASIYDNRGSRTAGRRS
jgi:hypothetical protein